MSIARFALVLSVVSLLPTTAAAANPADEPRVTFTDLVAAHSAETQEPRESLLYRVAFGAEAAMGAQSLDDATVGNQAGVNARWQIAPPIGVGGSYTQFDAGPQLRASLVGLYVSLHPIPGYRVDPYLRLGPVCFVEISGLNASRGQEPQRLGFEGVLGIDVTFAHFAFGPDLRLGATSDRWGMLGLHAEARL